MKQSTLEYRPFQTSDYPALEEIILKTWKYDRMGSLETAKKIAKVYLASCLINQTFTCVAVSDGKPVGVVMGKNKQTHRKPLRFRIRQFFAIVQIGLSKEGRKLAKIFSRVSDINENLLKNVNTSFDGELAFFVLSENVRGKGIGKQLYQRFLDYMASENLNTFFLFTDTSCNYKFYEYQGLQQLTNQSLYIQQKQENMEFFIYGQVDEKK
ncbi:GNAT family N-acetyltransferase [Paraliobacillus salinarum]|uniref:GNAT family N-acetyltransferase n=1 Tax=Paraliobacillus salinarum TaxID=1158996 RepID=UPI0015F4BA1B|nr:GNAT family N-acetyltransferase [Paraliobacillus salinarum]